MRPTDENDQFKFHEVRHKLNGDTYVLEWTGTHWILGDDGNVFTPAQLNEAWEYVGFREGGVQKVPRVLAVDPLAELAKLIGGKDPFGQAPMSNNHQAYHDIIAASHAEQEQEVPAFLKREAGIAEFNEAADRNNRKVRLLKLAEKYSRTVGGFFMGTACVLVGLLTWMSAPEGAPWWFLLIGIGIALIMFQFLALLNVMGLLLVFGASKDGQKAGEDFDWVEVANMWPQDPTQEVQWFVPTADNAMWNVLGGYVIQGSRADLDSYDDGEYVTHWKPLPLPPVLAIVPHITQQAEAQSATRH